MHVGEDRDVQGKIQSNVSKEKWTTGCVRLVRKQDKTRLLLRGNGVQLKQEQILMWETIKCWLMHNKVHTKIPAFIWKFCQMSYVIVTLWDYGLEVTKCKVT